LYNKNKNNKMDFKKILVINSKFKKKKKKKNFQIKKKRAKTQFKKISFDV